MFPNPNPNPLMFSGVRVKKTIAILNKPICLMIAVMVSLSLSGCASLTRDVSGKEKYWGGYKHESTYELIQNVFLMEVDSGLAGHRLALVPEGKYQSCTRIHSSPLSIEEYKRTENALASQSGSQYQRVIDVKGLIPAECRIMFVRLEQHIGFSLWYGVHNDLTPYAKIIDGIHMGKIVSIEDLSTSYIDADLKPILWKPDNRLLKDVR